MDMRRDMKEYPSIQGLCVFQHFMTLAVPDDVVGPKKKIVDELWWEFFSYPSQWWYHRPEKVNGNNCSFCTALGCLCLEGLVYTQSWVECQIYLTSLFWDFVCRHMQGIQILNIRRKHRRHSGLMTDRNPPGCEQT